MLICSYVELPASDGNHPVTSSQAVRRPFPPPTMVRAAGADELKATRDLRRKGRERYG
jgi:hypothetical protein